MKQNLEDEFYEKIPKGTWDSWGKRVQNLKKYVCLLISVSFLFFFFFFLERVLKLMRTCRRRANKKRNLIRAAEEAEKRRRIQEVRNQPYAAKSASSSQTQCLICDESVPDDELEAHIRADFLNMQNLVRNFELSRNLLLCRLTLLISGDLERLLHRKLRFEGRQEESSYGG